MSCWNSSTLSGHVSESIDVMMIGRRNVNRSYIPRIRIQLLFDHLPSFTNTCTYR